MNTVKDNLIDLCIIVTVTFAMLIGLELAVKSLSYIKREFYATYISSTILKQEWGTQYAADELGLAYRHVDYVEFREKAYRSATITVDEEGRRSVPGNCENNSAFTIWTFGGSTMFGYGVPDHFTIPAYLAKLLNRQGHCSKILNFGSASWVSSQSLIELIENLKRGLRPQAVIFYDGINDSSVVADGGRPGGISPNAHDQLNRAFSQEYGILGAVARSSLLVGVVLNRIVPNHLKTHALSAVLADIPGHAKAMAAIYAQNVRMVEMLAKEYGFSAYFFLQPFPTVSRKKLTSMEKTVFGDNELERDLFRSLYRAYDKEPTLIGHPRYFDISGLFDGLSEELFADSEHLLPEGNRIVAERIAKEILLPAGVSIR